MKKMALFVPLLLVLSVAGCNRNQYRVVERLDRYMDKEGHEVLGYGSAQIGYASSAYDHDEIHFVLKRGNQKIRAVCDLSTVSNQAHAGCGMRVLQEYECTQNGKEVSAGALADLFCKDGNGNIAYLYVSKEE